jgi:hypothetical protein
MNHAISKALRSCALCALVTVVAVLSSAPRPAAAGTDYDLRLGVYTDAGGLAIGGGLLSSVGTSDRWFFNPNIELAFGDNERDVTLNGDLHYDFASAGSWSVYMGGGPAIVATDPDIGDSKTDLGLNVLGGMSMVRGASRPFVQLKGILSDNSELALMGGIRF